MIINIDIKKFYFHIIFSDTYEDEIQRTGDKVLVHGGYLNKEFNDVLEKTVQKIRKDKEITLHEDELEIDINKRTLEIEISIGGYTDNKVITIVFKGNKGYLTYVTIEY